MTENKRKILLFLKTPVNKTKKISSKTLTQIYKSKNEFPHS